MSMQELRVATVFSGIGAIEESLKQLNISHVIKFACDNGEREPKTDLKTLFKVAKSVLSESKAEDLIRLYINIIFTKRKIKNAVLEEDVHNLYKEIRPLEIKAAIKKIDSLDDIFFEEESFNFKLRYEEIAEAKNILTQEEVHNFVEEWYATTRTPNYVKKSYLANYQIENDAWYEDVRFLDGKQYNGSVDLFCGGSPCQSFSTYGKKKGLEDARGTLFYDYARLIKEISPKVFIYENVKGLLTHDKGRTWDIIKNIFEKLNYKIYHKVLDAQHYGLPQMRERIFVVGIRDDIAKKASFQFPSQIQLTKTSKDYLDKEVDNIYYLGQKGFEWATSKSKNKNKTRVNRDIIGCQTANQQDNWIGDLRVEYPQQRHYNDPRIYIGVYEGHPAVARKMTPNECVRLMGFEHFKIVVNDIKMYRQAGNSIAVPVLNSLIKQLLPFLDVENKIEICEQTNCTY